MKKVLLTITGILLITLAGFYFYSVKTTQPPPVDLLAFVPDDAVFIYENKKQAYTKKDKPDLSSWLRKILAQDSVFISPLRSKDVAVSWHIIGKQDFGIIYYLPDSLILQDISFKKLTTSARSKRRNFIGSAIVELPAPGKTTISYTTIGKNIILSRQSLLIEDVIRSNNEPENSFRTKNDELFHLLPTDAGQGKVYADVNAVARFCGIFLQDDLASNLFKTFGGAVVTDARIEDQTLALNGYATDSASGKISLASLFNDQHPATTEIQKIVSNRTLIFVHYGIPDFKAWNKRRSAYRTFFNQIRTVDLSSEFYAALTPESGYCYMDGSKGQTDDVLLLTAKKEHTDKLARILSSAAPIENYSNYAIYAIDAPGTVHDYLWPLTENKNLNYYTRHDPYFLLAENIEVLKGFINDIEEDNTWGKSSEWNNFFNTSSLETNVSIDLNGELLTPWILKHLNSRWDSLSIPHDWGDLKKGSLQFSRLNQSYYFNGVLQFDSKKRRSSKSRETSSVPQMTFPSEIVSIALVRNHGNNATELLVQTSDEKLTLVGSDFKLLFDLDLKDKIQGQVYQIDYFKNRKLQYLFLAGRSLYLVDRLGNVVKGFPRVIETPAEPEFLSVLDYDNTHNYRFLIADQKGGLTMVDKEGKTLDGWQAVSLQSKLFSAPRLVRSGSRDYIIAVDNKGSVTAFNRKGEKVDGFPASIAMKPQGDWYFEKINGGKDAMTFVSAEGVKVQLDLKGKIVNTENYVRAAPDSRFSLMMSSTSDDYAISRVDKGKIAVLNRKGEILFEKENPGSEIMETAYASPISGEKIFMFRDTQQDFTHVFNERGKTLFDRPLESSQLPKASHRGKDPLILFTVLNADLKKISP